MCKLGTLQVTFTYISLLLVSCRPVNIFCMVGPLHPFIQMSCLFNFFVN